MTIEYDGSEYHGSQRQPNGRTIQGELEQALGVLLKEKAILVMASRTDAGVHAIGQVANFTTETGLKLNRIQNGLNGILPPTIRINEIDTADSDFHARHDAILREYEYNVWNAEYRSVFFSKRAYFVPGRLDRERMRRALEQIVGKHDFSAFCVATSAENGCIRNVYAAFLEEVDDSLLRIRIKANAFVHQMVRSIVGTVVEIGLGKKEPGLVGELLETGERMGVGMTAPSYGLFLIKVGYKDDI